MNTTPRYPTTTSLLSVAAFLRHPGLALASADHAARQPGRDPHPQLRPPPRPHHPRPARRPGTTCWRKWSIPYAPRPLDPAAAFGRQAPVILEIGFGMGETTEPHRAWPGRATTSSGWRCSTPAWARCCNASRPPPLPTCASSGTTPVEVLRDMIAPDSLAGVHVYFPDPWPKKRHHKRRLIQPPFVRPAGQPRRAGRLRALRHRLGTLRRADARRC